MSDEQPPENAPSQRVFWEAIADMLRTAIFGGPLPASMRREQPLKGAAIYSDDSPELDAIAKAALAAAPRPMEKYRAIVSAAAADYLRGLREALALADAIECESHDDCCGCLDNMVAQIGDLIERAQSDAK